MSLSRKNDIEVLVEMLDRAGVVYERQIEADELGIRIIAKRGPKNEGYFEFFTEFVFIGDQLDRVGVWE